MKSLIKKIAVSIYSFFEHLGQARAAGILARSGNFEAAKAVMMSDKKPA